MTINARDRPELRAEATALHTEHEPQFVDGRPRCPICLAVPPCDVAYLAAAVLDLTRPGPDDRTIDR